MRGFRVELGEVKSALARLDDISKAVVIAQPHGANWPLVGYCAMADAERRNWGNVVSELQSELAQQLPEYMVPGVLVVLPLTVNGKVDRQALPEPLEVPCQSRRSANTPQERLICEAMEKLLNLQVVSAEDDFFALGGDSIFAMSLGNQLRREGWRLRPKEIFAGRTPVAMARLMMPFADEHAPASQRSRVVDSLPILRWYNQQGQQAFLHGVWLNTPAGLTVPRFVLIMGQLLQLYPTLGATLNGRACLLRKRMGRTTRAPSAAITL